MSGHKTSSNRDRWLVSYADFITLLFAFFVVMYSVSSLNEGKFKVLSEALEEVFTDPLKGLEPLQPGKLQEFLSNYGREDDYEPTIQIKGDERSKQQLVGDLTLDQIEEQMRDRFKGMIDDQIITINQTKDWLEIEINSKMFFLPGTAALIREAERVIGDIAKIIKRVPNPVVVEGFTDNVPISNEIYPSNWELSTDRANSVVRALAGFGVQQQRLSSRGYGENFPIADNSNAGGREKNRRVVILIETLENSRWNHLKQIMHGSAVQPEVPQAAQPAPLVPLSKPETTKPSSTSQDESVFDDGSIQLIQDDRGGSSPDAVSEKEE